MKVKEITKDSILFDNGKALTYYIDNPFAHPVFDLYVDFLSLPKRVYETEYMNSCVIGTNWTILKVSDTSKYSYNCLTSNFDEKHMSCYDERNTGLYIFGEYVPLFKKKKELSETQLIELENQIQLSTNKWGNSEYSLFDKISGEIKVYFTYDNEVIAKFSAFDFLDLPGNYIHSDEPIHYELNKVFKIVRCWGNCVEFSNGKTLTANHMETFGVENFADFAQMDSIAWDTEFYENELVFEYVDDCGFRFGNRGGNMVFVPCYSEKNGHYDAELNIYYDGKLVLCMPVVEGGLL